MDIHFGDLEILARHGMVRWRGQTISVRPTEFRLLLHLAGDPDRVHCREDLLATVWHSFPQAQSRTVDMHIARLRRALGEARGAICTVRRVGYRFDPSRLPSVTAEDTAATDL